MDKEEQHFLFLLKEFNKNLESKEMSQEEILQNDQHGVFITFGGITLNYNLQEFDHNKNEYLTYQAERHRIFLDVLQKHRLERKKELWRLNSRIYALFTNRSGLDVSEEMEKTSLKIAFDEMYKEAAGIGKYFLEARRDEGVVTDLKPVMANIIGLSESIYQNTRELEITDMAWLQYFTEKQSVAKNG